MTSATGMEPVPRAPASPVQTPDGAPVSVVHLASEYYPFARTGGLAEAVSCLATFQHAAGLPVSVIMPLYRTVRDEAPDLEPVGAPFAVQLGPRAEEARIFRIAGSSRGPRVYFIEHLEYFNRAGLYGEAGVDYPDNARRFAFFSLAAATALPRLVHGTTILHAHDWHTALAPVYLRSRLAHEANVSQTAVVVSVHNAGFQGYFPAATMPDVGLPWDLFNFRQLEWYGHMNFLKGGLAFADQVTTVSPTHREELRTPGGGFGLHDMFLHLGDRFVGILNGIDQREWNPETDTQITARYSAAELEGKRRCKTALQRTFGLPQRRRVPLFAFTGRLATQKGLDLILQSPELLDLDAQFVFLGGGDKRYEDALVDLALHAPDRVGVQLDFTDRLEHRLMAGADIFLMPSQYEPCGLTQMRAQRYGALPVVRRVGGLADTVEDDVTGFMFDDYDAPSFRGAALRAMQTHLGDIERWRRMQRTAMARDFSWERATEQYLEVYRRAVGAMR